MRINIGPLLFTIEGGETLKLLPFINGFDVFAINEVCSHEKGVVFDQCIVVPNEASLITQYDFKDEDAVCRFFVCGSESYYFVIDGKYESVFLRYVIGENSIIISSVTNISFLRYILLIAYSLFVVQEKCATIHGSCVVINNEAVLFLGESGTGKSTHAKLWLDCIDGAWLLNDDCPIVSVTSMGNFLYGSLWSGKTPCFNNNKVPLKAIVRLSQGPENNIQRLENGFLAFGSVFPSLTSFLSHDRYYASLLIDVANRMVASVPVYHLKCLPNTNAAKVCYSMLFE